MSNRTIAMLQPGRTGDIIICLPIAKWHADQGDRVVWPVPPDTVAMMARAVDYVDFVPTARNDRASVVTAAGKFDAVVDIGFGFSGWEQLLVERFERSGLTFDAYKYHMAGMDIMEKYRLDIKRDTAREKDLESMLGCDFLLDGSVPYCCRHRLSSRGEVWMPDIGGNVVDIRPVTDSVFDWIGVIERASSLMMVDSSMLNLANQMFPKKTGKWKPWTKNWPRNLSPHLHEGWSRLDAW